MKPQNLIEIVNKKAQHQYEILHRFDAGMILKGTEIKSIRLGNTSMAEAYGLFIHDELYIRGLHIAEYKFGSSNNHEAQRDRKLLLTKNEIKKIKKRLVVQGMTLIPLRIYISERGFAKIEIGIARGKNYYDKRQSLKEKDSKRELDRIKKYKK